MVAPDVLVNVAAVDKLVENPAVTEVPWAFATCVDPTSVPILLAVVLWWIPILAVVPPVAPVFAK